MTQMSLPICKGGVCAMPKRDVEAEARDAALKLLSDTREQLIERAFDIACELCHKHGRVTSTQVFAVMAENQDWKAAMDAVDPRWMGCVFRRKTWVREGWLNGAGSHKRPISVWRFADKEVE
jgi:hypothetical protein